MYHKSNAYTDKVYIEGPGTAPPKKGSQFYDEEGLASSGKKERKTAHWEKLLENLTWEQPVGE